MSSTYQQTLTDSYKAVDGQKTDFSYSGGQCAVSADGYKTAWWWVDLGDLSSITNITIYYRTDNVHWGKYKNFVLKMELMFNSRNTSKSLGSIWL